MRRIIPLLFAATILFSSKIIAQRSCASFEHLQEQMKNNPGFAKKVADDEQGFQNFLKNHPAGRTTTVTIPVVVHVVYNGAEQNISDAQVQSQINVMNE